jgi:hypothetical protein
VKQATKHTSSAATKLLESWLDQDVLLDGDRIEKAVEHWADVKQPNLVEVVGEQRDRT